MNKYLRIFVSIKTTGMLKAMSQLMAVACPIPGNVEGLDFQTAIIFFDDACGTFL
jgi:hypothetical protein